MTSWNPLRHDDGRFLPGQGGRPRGARNRAGRKLREAWEKSMGLHVSQVIEEVRQESPSTYLKLLMKAVPTPDHDEVEPLEHLTEEEMQAQLRAYCAQLLIKGYGPDQAELADAYRRAGGIHPPHAPDEAGDQPPATP